MINAENIYFKKECKMKWHNTYLGGLGFIFLAIYKFTINDTQGALTDLTTGITIITGRNAIDKIK